MDSNIVHEEKKFWGYTGITMDMAREFDNFMY